MKYKKHFILSFVVALFLTLQSCQQPGGNSTGSEYMPDMAHSVAYEANYYSYYYNNRWGGEADYYHYAKPRHPVAGTIPRGGAKSDDSQGSVPYHYGNTEEERTRATNEIIQNPLHITDAGLQQGKDLYNIYCGICHGDNADGLGYIVREDGGKYPVQPAILNSDEFKAASNGRYYHAIMHGKNLMGAYRDKLNYEERWNVIHYIRSLHAKEAGLVYTQYENTLNSIDVPAGDIVVVQEDMGHDGDSHGHNSDHDGDHHDTDDHNHEANHDSDEHSHDSDHDGH